MKWPYASKVFLFGLAVLLLPFSASGVDFIVTTSSDADCSDADCDLQSALSAAAVNSVSNTIEIDLGTFIAVSTFEYNDTTGLADKTLIINGSGRNDTILSGNNAVRVLYLKTSGTHANISVKNLKITAGLVGISQNGGGLWALINNSNVTLENCDVTDNQAASDGGGACLALSEFGNGLATINNCLFDANQAGNGAGLWVSYAMVDMLGNTFSNNILETAGKGGGAYVASTSGPVTIGPEDVPATNFFLGNTGAADCQGGGLYVNSGGFSGITVNWNTFGNNTLDTGSSGGGAYLASVDGPINLSSNRFLSNNVGATDISGFGGGGLRAILFGSFADFTAVNNVFYQNEAGFVGGALIESELGRVDFINNTSASNTSTNGAGVYLNVSGSDGKHRSTCRCHCCKS